MPRGVLSGPRGSSGETGPIGFLLSKAGFALKVKGGENEMSQICDSFSQIYMTFPDLKRHNFTIEGMSEYGKEVVTISTVMPEVDKVTGYSDNPKHSCLSFLCEYL